MKTLISLLFLSSSFCVASDRFSEMDVFQETPSAIYGMWPFKVLNNNWAASHSIKKHFDQQRSLLNYLSSSTIENSANKHASFAATGDILRIAQGHEYLTPALKTYLSNFDIVTANLETLVSKNFPTQTKNFFLVNSSATVVSSTQIKQPNKDNIFTILSTANNHSFDYPEPARKDTLDSLNKYKVLHNGLIDEKKTPYTLFEKNGITFSYYAVSTFVNDTQIEKKSHIQINPKPMNMNLLPWDEKKDIDLKNLRETILAMRAVSEVVLISIHWGTEHESYPRPEQISVAHQLASYGADIIIGNHSHAIQPSEACFINGAENELPKELADTQRKSGCVIKTSDGRKRKVLIHYSLGNFVGFTPFFWHQLGLVNSVTFTKNSRNAVDWHSPKSKITYDYVKKPPYGEHRTGLLSDFIDKENCFQKSCPLGTKFLASHAEKHIHNQTLSTKEEVKLVLVSAYLSFREVIRHLPRLIFKGYT